MGEVIGALERFDRETLRRRQHPLVGPASMHCALISGGAGLSTYAPECVLKTERRTLPGETAEQVLDELRAVIAGAADDVEVRNLFDRSPHTCGRDEPIAQCLLRAAREVTGDTPSEIWSRLDGCSDLRLLDRYRRRGLSRWRTSPSSGSTSSPWKFAPRCSPRQRGFADRAPKLSLGGIDSPASSGPHHPDASVLSSGSTHGPHLPALPPPKN
jgi:hypothetical protein